jgi:hypothetical protein
MDHENESEWRYILRSRERKKVELFWQQVAQACLPVLFALVAATSGSHSFLV